MRTPLFILVAIIFSHCVFDADDLKLSFYNRSSQAIYYRLKVDTVLAIKDVDYLESVHYLEVNTGDSARPLFARKGEGWERKLNEVSKDSTFRLYVFQVDTVKRYGWRNIIESRRYDRLDFTADDLDRLNWKIVYKN